ESIVPDKDEMQRLYAKIRERQTGHGAFMTGRVIEDVDIRGFRKPRKHQIQNLYYCFGSEREESIEETVVSEDVRWEESFRTAIELASIRQRATALLHNLEREVAELKAKSDQPTTIPVTINSLAPRSFELLKPIPVVIRVCGEDYIASFFDANINA